MHGNTCFSIQDSRYINVVSHGGSTLHGSVHNEKKHFLETQAPATSAPATSEAQNLKTEKLISPPNFLQLILQFIFSTRKNPLFITQRP